MEARDSGSATTVSTIQFAVIASDYNPAGGGKFLEAGAGEGVIARFFAQKDWESQNELALVPANR